MTPKSLPFTDRAWSRPDPPARSTSGGFPRRRLLAAAAGGAVGLLGSCSKTGEPFVFEYDIVELHRGTDDRHWTAIVIASADASLRAQARVTAAHLEVVVTNDPPVTITPPKGNWGVIEPTGVRTECEVTLSQSPAGRSFVTRSGQPIPVA